MMAPAALGASKVARRSLAPALFLLATGWLLFPSVGRDDAYISYWPAYELSQTGRILNYNGDFVEQTSSLAHVLLLAVLQKAVPLQIPVVGILTSTLFGALSVIATTRLATRVQPAIATAAGWLAATAVWLIYWSFGGLESTLAAFSVTVWLLTCVRVLEKWDGRTLTLWCAATALILTVRPEMIIAAPVVLLATALTLALRMRLQTAPNTAIALRRTVCLCTFVAVIDGALLACRWAYFGAYVPQPANAKQPRLCLDALRVGWSYFTLHAWRRWDCAVWFLIFPAIGLAVWRAVRRPQMNAAEFLTALFAATYIAFIMVSGGDWMEVGRFLVPAVPVVIVLSLSLLHGLAPRSAWRPAVLVLIGLNILGTLRTAAVESVGAPLWCGPPPAAEVESPQYSWLELANRLHFRDGVFLTALDCTIRALRARKAEPISIMSAQMGMVAYYAAMRHQGHVRLVDMRGLCTNDFTQSPRTSQLPRGRVGLRWTLDRYFDIRRRAGPTWAPGNIDVLYALGTTGELGALLDANGFRIVYEQSGPIRNGSRYLPGQDVLADQIIAVRRDLLPPDWGIPARQFSR